MWHVAEIMSAMADKRTLVVIDDIISDVSEQVSSAATVADISCIVLRNTTVTYSLLSKESQRFFSLDMHEHSRAIRDIDDATITHCHAHHEAPPRVGDVFAASVHGNAVHSDAVKFGTVARHMHTSHTVRKNAAAASGFLMLRKVTAVDVSEPSAGGFTSASAHPTTTNCFVYHTEDLHPLEIFEGFTLDSKLSHPFSVTYMTLPSESDAMLGEHFVSDLQFNTLYTAPVSCSNITKWSPTNYFGYDYNTLGDPAEGSSFYLIYGYTFACMDYQAEIPGSFNMNYNYNTKQADSYFTLGGDSVSGIECSNCYAYMGAQFDVHIEFSKSFGFGFMTSLSGGAGVNVRVDATDPRISGISEFSFMEEASWYNSVLVTTGKHHQSIYTLCFL